MVSFIIERKKRQRQILSPSNHETFKKNTADDSIWMQKEATFPQIERSLP